MSFNNVYSLLESVPRHCKEVRNVIGIYRNICIFNTKLGITLIAELATCVANNFLPVRERLMGRYDCCPEKFTIILDPLVV